jgi:hypothetical protein
MSDFKLTFKNRLPNYLSFRSSTRKALGHVRYLDSLRLRSMTQLPDFAKRLVRSRDLLVNDRTKSALYSYNVSDDGWRIY